MQRPGSVPGASQECHQSATRSSVGTDRSACNPARARPTVGGLEGQVHEFICCPDGSKKILYGDLLQDTYVHVILKFNLLKCTDIKRAA